MKKTGINEKQLLKILPALLLGISFLCWPLLYIKYEHEDAETAAWIEKADNLVSKKIYTEAKELYTKAFDRMNGDYGLCLKIAECCRELDGISEFVHYCDAACAIDPEREEAYMIRAEYYYGRQKYDEVYSVCNLALSNGCKSDKICELLDKLDEILIFKYLAVDDVGDWHKAGAYSYAVFERSGKYGILRSDGNVSMEASYDWLGTYSKETGTIPAMIDGELCWIDTEGNRRAVPDAECVEIGLFSDGAAPYNGECGGYLSADGSIILSGLEYASAFSNGVAAVKKNGKWALIDSSFCSITAFCFDDIICDSNLCCSEWQRTVCVFDGRYYLCDLRGNMLSEGYDEIRLPASDDEPVAFREGELWGFLNQDGRVATEPEFTDALSYSQGLAPVSEGDGWFYIDINGEKTGDEIFESAAVFSREGCACVKKNSRICALYTAGNG